MGLQVADIAIAVVYFAVAFDALFGVLVLYTMVAFLVWTVVVSDFRTGYRKKQNEKVRTASAAKLFCCFLLAFAVVRGIGHWVYEEKQLFPAVRVVLCDAHVKCSLAGCVKRCARAG
jgi:ABC-type transport system involved in Fe-S cluster assembly fused permease/ATPase subunit